MIEITVPNHNDSIVEIDINERTYYFHFQWNSEDEYWAIGVQNSEQTTIVSGIKLVSNYDVFKKYLYTGIPQISLVAYMSNGDDKPLRNSFTNGQSRLIYESKI